MYINAYHRITSLYRIDCDEDDRKTYLHVFDTEKHTKNIYNLNISELLDHDTYITLLPNGELFCFGSWIYPGLALIIDRNYQARVLPQGMPYHESSAIYFNRNVYCFGGMEGFLGMPWNYSKKFNLDKNQWDDITSMPIDDYCCHSIIFNGQILISGRLSENLLLYSIDINSFSIIPYKYAKDAIKILINAGRLYLIECKNDKCGLIYESELEDEYNWKIVSKSLIGYTYQAYHSCNKERVYIMAEDYSVEYYEFDLKQRKLLKTSSFYDYYYY